MAERDVLYVWQAFENGHWETIIAVLLPGKQGVGLLELGPRQLVTSSPHVSHLYGLAAVAHHDGTGLPVRRARYVLDEVEREMP